MTEEASDQLADQVGSERWQGTANGGLNLDTRHREVVEYPQALSDTGTLDRVLPKRKFTSYEAPEVSEALSLLDALSKA
jgi:hypothetical protein